jgi:hypothetical protein
MTETENKLMQAYKKYIDFLTDSYREVFDITHEHGYTCSQDKFELGESLRADIKKLEDECLNKKENISTQILRTTIDRSI